MAGVYSVTQVNSYIKNMFDQDFALRRIQVKGEVSNCKYHGSGHIYFTLKDGSAAIAAVMFAGQRKGLSFRMEEGQQVIVTGSIEVYARDGKYQLYARGIVMDGVGDLFARFQKLRDELEEMGMFDPGYKQPVPKYAGRIGIVTAPTGAAIRDIMNISSRRNPYVRLFLYPALVQGEGAKESIVRGIQVLDRMGLDVLIVGRGGGSIEDLWAFNEEAVARAIFECKTPVISAVGHETDVTIADYVADMRAPTPSAAAELAVFDYLQFQGQLSFFTQSLRKAMERKTEKHRFQAEQYRLHLQLFDPAGQVREKRQRLADLQGRIRSVMEQRILDSRHRLAVTGSRLDGLSPLKKIGGGYGFITDGSEKRVESVSRLKRGEEVRIRLTDGRITAQVTKKERMALKAGLISKPSVKKSEDGSGNRQEE